MSLKNMRKRSVVSTVVLFAVIIANTVSVSFAKTVFLSSLDLKQMTTGWSDAKADHEISGGPLKINGTTFAHGVGTHAVSRMRANLAGNAENFRAKVGIDDGTEGKGSIEFIVLGDGKVLWKSGL